MSRFVYLTFVDVTKLNSAALSVSRYTIHQEEFFCLQHGMLNSHRHDVQDKSGMQELQVHELQEARRWNMKMLNTSTCSYHQVAST